MLERVIACAALLLGLAGCGDLPRPFAGNPGRQALMLSVPPPPKLMVPNPTDSLLGDREAAAWSHAMTDALVASELPAFNATPHAGDWILHLSANLQGGQVTPTYALTDARGGDRGRVTGSPVPAGAWAQGSPQVLGQSAAEVAPQIVALLRAVDATLKQSDPNSLYNRPARIFFAGVTGAPGDGKPTLTHGIRSKIPETGDQLVTRPEFADYILRATVQLTDEPGGQQQVEIHWFVADRTGRVIGDIAQGHDLPRGTLDHHWGDIASVITDQAAGAVHDAITNASGRHDKHTAS